ncbi:membrane protein [Clostridia bacterium]|nr:membrane protein [Clostridia bacterium]
MNLLRKCSFILLALALVVTLAACTSNGSTTGNSNSGGAVADGSLSIPTAEISNNAKFYPVNVDGTNMEVVAVKASDGSIRTAFNTCQVCNGSPMAYFVQKGNTVECQNCGNQFPMDRVGITAGGCNPVPVPESGKTTTGDTITISYETLAAAKPLFKVWKEVK